MLDEFLVVMNEIELCFHVILDGFSILFDFNYNFVLFLWNSSTNIINYLSENIESIEIRVTYYIKLLTDFVYFIPRVFDIIFNFSNYIPLLPSFNSLGSCLVLILIMFLSLVLLVTILYYKHKNYLLNKRNEELEMNPLVYLCCVCRFENSNVVLLPCKHLCLCLRCFYLLKKNSQNSESALCPICRSEIREEIKIFTS